MKTIDILEETYAALTGNKVRTGLTMLGIIIGIASVIALVAIGNGAKASIQSSIDAIGSNLLVVTPGATASFGGPSAGRGTAETLTVGDANAIASQVSNVAAVALDVTARDQVTTTQGTNTNTSVIGTSSSYTTVRNEQIAEGTFITDADVADSSLVAVIGPTTATDLFPAGTDPVGQIIRIKGSDFTIVGETVAKGGTGFTNPDDAIYIPYTTAQHYITGNQYLTEIDISGAAGSDSTTVENDVTALLLQRHNVTVATEDFSILNQADIVATASSVTGTFTVLLGAVAGISLLVGGIGIMNMMLTTVTERTREIGLRKAIGAKPGDISIQFLTESVVLTFTGGLIGVILGGGIAIILNKLGIVAAQVSLGSVLLAFGVSAGIGILFGWYPAKSAARMSPIEALRFE